MACATRPVNLRSKAAHKDALDPLALSTKLDNPTSQRERDALGLVVHLTIKARANAGTLPEELPALMPP